MLKNLPEFIQNIVDKIFDKNYSLFSFKHDYDPEQLEKNEQIRMQQEKNRRINLFNRNKSHDYDDEIEKDIDDGMEL